MLFGIGMMALLVTAIFGSWILMDPEAALASTILLAYSIYLTHRSYSSITNMFHFNEDDAVNFDDLLDATQTLIPKGASASHERVVERRGFGNNGGSPHGSSSRLSSPKQGVEIV